MAGMPMTVYPNWGGDTYEMECAIPVVEGALGDKKRIMLKSTAAGMAVKAVHMGDYHQLDKTHAEVDRYVADHSLIARGAPYEVYVTDPGLEPDTAKWITHVYYPVTE
jgi:effector-binding domain-containing protein